MPRVHTTKSARLSAKDRSCVRCGVSIKPGETFHQWSFRYSGTRYQHGRCGYPRPSQLTQSKMVTVLLAQESAQDSMAELKAETGVAESIQGLLNDVGNAAREVGEEYREAAESMGGAGGQNEERADGLDSYADEMESWEPETEEPAEGSSEEDWDEYLEAIVDEANQAMGIMPF